jgi:hypothetical protein
LPRTRKPTEDEEVVSEKSKVIPVRLKREAYRDLIGVKGLLIAEKRRNFSFSDTVAELVKFFYAHRKTGDS